MKFIFTTLYQVPEGTFTHNPVQESERSIKIKVGEDDVNILLLKTKYIIVFKK